VDFEVLTSFIKVAKSRRSVKEEFSRRTVGKRVLERLLDVARWAPSAHNSQPWSFIVIRDKPTKARLAENMAKAWRRDFEKDKTPNIEAERRISASITRISNAPVLVVACLTTEHMQKYVEEKRKKCEYLMTVQSVAAAIQNLLLAARESGLGSCWMCAPLFCPETVRETLGVPDHVDPQALVTLGYFKGRISPPPRRPASETIHFDCW
jgi:F420 biosynthesis protein FbiB-like protein